MGIVGGLGKITKITTYPVWKGAKLAYEKGIKPLAKDRAEAVWEGVKDTGKAVADVFLGKKEAPEEDRGKKGVWGIIMKTGRNIYDTLFGQGQGVLKLGETRLNPAETGRRLAKGAGTGAEAFTIDPAKVVVNGVRDTARAVGKLMIAPLVGNIDKNYEAAGTGPKQEKRKAA